MNGQNINLQSKNPPLLLIKALLYLFHIMAHYTLPDGCGLVSYLFLVMSLMMHSHRRWFLQMRRHAVRLMCSYQQAIDAPKEINGHTRRGATLLITNWLPISPLGT